MLFITYLTCNMQQSLHDKISDIIARRFTVQASFNTHDKCNSPENLSSLYPIYLSPVEPK